MIDFDRPIFLNGLEVSYDPAHSKKDFRIVRVPYECSIRPGGVGGLFWYDDEGRFGGMSKGNYYRLENLDDEKEMEFDV